MPEKEITRLAVETSGNAWQWLSGAVTGLGAIMFAIWANITGRLKALETTLVTSQMLDKHIADEDKKFEVLFEKHDEVLEKISVISNGMARIEGKLENGGYRKTGA